MDFPKAKVADAPYDFSFSGVKSAVLNHLNKCKMIGENLLWRLILLLLSRDASWKYW